MESSDLFSHPHQPEFIANRDRAADPVEAPAFSDRIKSDSPPSTSAS
jgi:hypothetical protein